MASAAPGDPVLVALSLRRVSALLKKYELKIIRVPTEPLHKSFAINFPQAYVVFSGAAYISARKIKIQTMYHKQNITNVFGGKTKSPNL